MFRPRIKPSRCLSPPWLPSCRSCATSGSATSSIPPTSSPRSRSSNSCGNLYARGLSEVVRRIQLTLVFVQLMFLPRALSAIADASNALERLSVVFEAETLDVSLNIDEQHKWGLDVQHASFTWSAPAPREDAGSKKKGGGGKMSKKERAAEKEKESASIEGHEPFQVVDLTMQLERGSLVAMCGAVGSGKSSILQGLISEMKQTSGTVWVSRARLCSSCFLTALLCARTFGGKVSYAAQTPFIQNATLRDNGELTPFSLRSRR